MLLYCPKCNNLVDKINDETYSQGSLIDRKCARCGTNSRYYVQYKAVIDRNWVKLTDKAKNDIMGVTK